MTSARISIILPFVYQINGEMIEKLRHFFDNSNQEQLHCFKRTPFLVASRNKYSVIDFLTSSLIH